MATPYIGFDNGSLEGQPDLSVGDTIQCPNCESTHKVSGGDGIPQSDILLMYICGDRGYLAGVHGKLVIGLKSDVSGTI